MARLKYKSENQKDAYTSPWSILERLLMLIWNITWLFLFRPTLKPMNKWRIFLLRIFGCKIQGHPFVSESARIKIPWQLELNDRSSLGPFSEIYNLGKIIIEEKVTIAQYAYLCGGTHDFDNDKLPLLIGDIIVGKNSFIGAKAILLPGINIGAGTIVGAGSVLTKDTDEWSIYAGNPAKFIKKRIKTTFV